MPAYFSLLFPNIFFFFLDYLNPIDLCNRMNTYILPEAGIHAFTCLLLLLGGQWVSLMLNLPLLAYNARKIIDKSYLLDATEIFRTLNKYKNESFAKLAFHLILFFYYLYCLIISIVADDS